jgi:hypothetical protein
MRPTNFLDNSVPKKERPCKQSSVFIKGPGHGASKRIRTSWVVLAHGAIETILQKLVHVHSLPLRIIGVMVLRHKEHVVPPQKHE